MRAHPENPPMILGLLLVLLLALLGALWIEWLEDDGDATPPTDDSLHP